MNLKRTAVSLSLLGLLATLSACQVDPFETAPGNLTPTKPVDRPVGKPWGIDVPDQMEFTEGRTDEYVIQAYVPAPARPVIAMADLPPGARFNASSGKLTWTPDYSAGNDSRDPSSDLKTYRTRILLSSTLEPQSVVEKSVLLVVHNVSRPVDLEWQQGMLQIREGVEFKTRVRIKSADFPQGPFGFFIAGLPSGLEISADPTDGAVFHLRVTPPMDTITHEDDLISGGFQGLWKARILVVDPSGKRTELPVDFRVLDSRQNALVSAPAMVQAVADARFQFTAEDPNREKAPLITIEGPNVGTLSVEDDDSGFISRRAVRWHNIPEAALGKNHQFKIKACVYGSRFSQDRCMTHVTEVRLEAQLLKEPAFDRAQWPVGELRYLRVGEQLRIKLPASNQNSDNYPLNFTIEPASMRSEVEYKLGEILLKPAQAGFKQFSITARIAQGLSRTESFALEVMPASWSRVLVLGDGLRDPEIVGTLKVFSGAQVMNPLLQELNDRALALRDAVVLGTSVFSDAQALAAAAPAIARARVLMVQTPVLEDLPADLAQTLSRLGFQVRGRYATVLGPNPPALTKFPVSAVAGAGLTIPYKPLQLSGTLTSESANPMLLTAAASGNCRAVVQGVYQSVPNLPGYELPLVLKCDQGGRRFVISGMEWGDLVPQTNMDQKIVSRWIEEVLK
jgi:hypothetical protein